MISAADLELVAKHSADRATFESNEATLLALPLVSQSAVLQRLRALDRYMGMPSPTAADAAILAADLGMSERNFYRLIRKFREHGPVAGLAPNFRVRQRPSAAADGLGKVAEITLERILQTEEDARWKDVVNEVLAACKAASVEPPSTAAIRRRLLALRAEGRLRDAGERIFGEKWLMDQTAITLTRDSAQGLEYVVVTLLIDRQTKLIGGVGLLRRGNPLSGVVAALVDAWSRVPEFASASLNVATRLRDFHWVDPEDVTVSRFMLDYGATRSGHGPRRHGENIFRMIGNRLGPYTLLIRSTASPQIVDEQLATAPLPFAKAEEVVRHAVGKWNEGILQQMKVGRSRDARRKRLIEIMRSMTDLFLPALDASSAAILKDAERNITHEAGAPRTR
jgi:hypothetical protein